MGKKPRSKGVDVTKAFLQPASVSDYITVLVAPNHVINVSEDELSPTQGSEAAFALRRDGKLDSTMKLCLNWRAGACHNHAACTFAHVLPYFSADNPNSASAPGQTSGAEAAARVAPASAAGSNSPGEGRSPWLSKVAPGATGHGSGNMSVPHATGSWGSKDSAQSTASGRGFVDLAEAMAAKAAQTQNRGGRAPSVSTPTTTPQPGAAPHDHDHTATPSAATGTQRSSAEAATQALLPLNSNSALATADPALQDLLFRQITGTEAGKAPGTTAAAPSVTGLATPRQQRVPAPRSGVFSASPFSTSPYVVNQPALSSSWGASLGSGDVLSLGGGQRVPHISPTLGNPTPAIRQLMTLLTADD